MLSDKVGRPIQESLLALLIYDDKHGGVVARTLSPDVFDGDYADIARRVANYWHTYNKAPKRQVDDIFADIFTARTGRDITYGDLFVHLLELHDSGINAQFLLDTIHRFTRFQSLRRLLVDSAEKATSLGEDSLEDIDRAIAGYSRAQVDSASSALTLFEYDSILTQLQSRSLEFDTGIRGLDKGHITPARGRLMLMLAPPGVGKTWSLIQIARRAMLRRKRVLFVSCEMAAYEVAGRFYQALLGVSTREAESTVTKLIFEDGKLSGFDTETIKSDFVLMDEDMAHIELAVRISKLEWLFNNLRIREYAPGTLTPDMLEAAIDIDAASTGFIPDMVIVDYLGIMKVDPNNLRITLGHNGIALKGLARKRNVAMITAQQVSREGMKEQKAGKEVDIEHTAEDWSLMGTADTAVTMSQTKVERQLGLMRLFVGKGRQEMARYAVLVTQNYTQGQFAIESHRIPASYTRVLGDFLKDREREQEADDQDED
jgi:replicative DNA helicase